VPSDEVSRNAVRVNFLRTFGNREGRFGGILAQLFTRLVALAAHTWDDRGVKIKPHIESRAVAFVVLLLGGTLMVPIGGCQLFNERMTAEPHSAYPEDIQEGEVFDVQVFREIAMLKFTNTTTRDFGDSVVWLNKRFSLAIPGFVSGETVELDLHNFVDEFGDTYRAGGFFAQRDPAPVVLVQIETVDKEEPTLFGFVIVENKYN